ncbi:polygalacturonase [Rhizomicrobium palustre]|uniref:Polygalacturonase n=1 Tax=Rhizomicrobium palustre TaxID=189966 RepID=A0A846MWT9_9PROT|nr:glycosyl hydrolase family 28 protein [Rhizomicrobium palustre]NIK87532.1 polygalacturonase [Rhizomicrobium palustre]
MLKSSLLASATLILATVPAAAQDARHVTEPVIPPACTTLQAGLTAVKDGAYQSLTLADEAKPDTYRIQRAIDSCDRGKAVVLKAAGAANAFLSGPLKLRSGVTLVVDKGTTVFASLNFKDFDVTPGSCGIVRPGIKAACKPFISVDDVSDAGIMGDGVLDGRAGITIPGLGVSAWDIAQKYEGKERGLFRMVVADRADNFTLYRITIKNSQNFNVTYNGGDGFTVWGVKVEAPKREPRSARPLSHNTDGIDPGNGARNITITRSYIRTGDDNIAIKGSGRGGVTNMTVSHNHFYWGHGMSIGSETYAGVSNILVTDLTLDGTDSGIRIKSSADRGGLVENVRYEDVCIRNSPRPIELTTHYAGRSGGRLPTYRALTFKDVTISGGGEISFDGYDNDHRIQPLLDGVFLSDAETAKYKYIAAHTDITYGAGGSNIAPPTDNDVTLTGAPGKATGSASCASRFVPWPE